jgi:predicted DNA binding protein
MSQRKQVGGSRHQHGIEIDDRPCVVCLEFPMAEFALAATIAETDAQFHGQHVVGLGERAICLLWVRGAGPETLDTAMGADPTVRTATRMASFDDEFLYRIETGGGGSLSHLVSEAGASVLTLSSDRTRWCVRTMFPSGEAFDAARGHFEAAGVAHRVQTVQTLDPGTRTQLDLTDAQYEILTIAYDEGYFEIPRKTDLIELAEKLGVSHQSLSERLRRAHKAMLEQTLSFVPEWAPELDDP